MFAVHVGLIVFMTVNTFENREIRGINVAIGTIVPFLTVRPGVYREVLGVVIPVCRRPSGRSMASLAIGREISSLMIGVGSGVVRRLVARVAQCWSCDITTGMTGDAHQADMGSSQREARRAVVKCCRRPGSRCVTVIAEMRE
jgi:hypothetical protein